MKLRVFLLSILLTATLCVSASQPVEGWWKGMLMQRLPTVFHLTQTDGELQGVVYSPAQTADSMPLADIVFADSLLSFKMPTLNASFSGKLTDGLKIKGTFVQGMQLPLTLEPASAEDARIQRPQTPKPPFFYHTEDVSFVTPDSITIGGTIAGPFARPAGVLVMVSGSGAQNRDEELFGHKPFAVIADYLARMGWVTLRYDDRGVGVTSGGSPDDTTLDFARDALAAVSFMRSRYPGLPVGLLGHSEGGTIALYDAAQNPESVDLVVSLAGMAVSGRDLMIRQNEMLAEYSGITPTEENHALMVETFDAIREPGSPAEVAARLDSIYVSRGVDSESLRQGITAMTTPWYIGFVRLDPTAWMSKIKVPVLALNGTWDVQVEASSNLAAVAGAIPSATIVSLDGLNHLFQESPSKSRSFEYANIQQTISPRALEAIAAFLTDFTRERNHLTK